MTLHPRERLTAYADRELDAAGAAEVERHLATCTECARELAVVRNLKGAMRAMHHGTTQKDLWSGIHRRLTRPAGWILIVAGLAVWIVLAAIRWFQEDLTLEWAAGTALLTGVIVLLVGIGHEQYRLWKSERYKDVDQ